MTKFSAASLFGPNFRRILFASCEFGGVDCNQPMLAQPVAATSTTKTAVRPAEHRFQPARGSQNRDMVPEFSGVGLEK